MSMQRINLYLPELRVKKEWLTADTIALSALGFTALMILASVLIKNGLKDYEEQVRLIENQKIAAEERVLRIKNMPRAANSMQFDRRLNQLRRAVAARQQIGQIIEGQNLGNESGFAASMQHMAMHAFSSISLEHIRISRGGTFVEMSGVSKTIEDVPLYLQKLRKEDSFIAAQFGLMSVKRDAKGKGIHEFSLGFESVYRVASELGGQP